MSKNRSMDKVPGPLLVAIDMSEITFTKHATLWLAQLDDDRPWRPA
jgi:hypothetical protein